MSERPTERVDACQAFCGVDCEGERAVPSKELKKERKGVEYLDRAKRYGGRERSARQGTRVDVLPEKNVNSASSSRTCPEAPPALNVICSLLLLPYITGCNSTSHFESLRLELVGISGLIWWPEPKPRYSLRPHNEVRKRKRRVRRGGREGRKGTLAWHGRHTPCAL